MTPGEAVGGLVNCLLIQGDKDRGKKELRGGSVQGAQLQRIASRCHCNVVYVSHGGQAEAEVYDAQQTVSNILAIMCTYFPSVDGVSSFLFLPPSV